MYGYRQEHHAEAGGLGQAAGAEGGPQGHHPPGHAGAVHGRQPGAESAPGGGCPQGRVTHLERILPQFYQLKKATGAAETHPQNTPWGKWYCLRPTTNLSRKEKMRKIFPCGHSKASPHR